jgi:hypothetical protein
MTIKHWPEQKNIKCELERTHSNYRNSDVWYNVIVITINDKDRITISMEDAVVLGHDLLKLVAYTHETEITQLKARLINYTDWTEAPDEYGKHVKEEGEK